MRFKSIAEIRKEFDEYLDETEDWITICSHEFSPSDIMTKESQLYENAFGEWIASRYEYVQSKGYKEVSI
jgi:hypothetical protein